MKQALRRTAWTVATAALVAGFAVPATAEGIRREVSPAAVASTEVAPTAIDRLTSTRTEFRSILVDTGLASTDVTEIVDRMNALAAYVSHASFNNPEALGGMAADEFVAAKAPGLLGDKGLAGASISHLAVLAGQWTNEQIAVDVEMAARTGLAPAVVEGSIR
jgi:hypothetical protein